MNHESTSLETKPSPLKSAVQIADEASGKGNHNGHGELPETVNHLKEEAVAKLRHGGEVIQERFQQGTEGYPLVMGMGFLALGFLIGMAFPHTKPEDRVIGPIADTVKKRGKEAGQEVVNASTQAAQRAIQPLRGTSMSKGNDPEHGIDS